MNHWLSKLNQQVKRYPDEMSVLVTVARVRGSAPREVGAKMIVASKSVFGTIGGGELERQSTQIASELVTGGASHRQMRNFPLGTNCGQCCGGIVDILFETVDHRRPPMWLKSLPDDWRPSRQAVLVTSLAEASRDQVPTQLVSELGALDVALRNCCTSLLAGPKVASHVVVNHAESSQAYLLEAIKPPQHNFTIFGAGHVGQAVVATLAGLDCHINWVDSRADMFPPDQCDNVMQHGLRDPTQFVGLVPAGSSCLVMTHSHALDFELCAQILPQAHIGYCGLIGSVSKRKRFVRLGNQLGLTGAHLAKLTCPIGIDGLIGKSPAEIAVSVAAQLLQQSAAQTEQSNQERLRAALPH